MYSLPRKNAITSISDIKTPFHQFFSFTYFLFYFFFYLFSYLENRVTVYIRVHTCKFIRTCVDENEYAYILLFGPLAESLIFCFIIFLTFRTRIPFFCSLNEYKLFLFHIYWNRKTPSKVVIFITVSFVFFATAFFLKRYFTQFYFT